MNSIWLIEDYIFANDFLRFLTGHLKNVKSHVFLKSEKNVKYVFSNTDGTSANWGPKKNNRIDGEIPANFHNVENELKDQISRRTEKCY